MRRLVFVVFAALAVSFAAPARAQDMRVLSDWAEADLRPMLQRLNATIADSGVDEDGLPWYEVVSAEGFRFFVDGTVCDNGRCRGARIVGYYSMPSGVSARDLMNRLDFAVVSLGATEDNRLRVLRYMILDHGITAANFQENIDVYLQVASAIGEQIGSQ
ncbi:MAG: hypothetical protein AB7O98_17530 [Hyphomonadaceae bacterium]